jgi:hypothetical protein
MPVLMRIGVSDTGATQDLAGLTPKAVDRVRARAINTTLKQVEREGAKVAAKASGLPSKAARERFFVERAKPGRPTGSVTVSHKALNLIRFVTGQKPTKRRPKVGVRAKAWGKRKVYPRTFFMPLRGKGQGRYAVMKRDAGAGRLPIESVWGPSVYQILRQTAEDRRLQDFGAMRFGKNLEREFDREQYRAKGRRRR